MKKYGKYHMYTFNYYFVNMSLAQDYSCVSVQNTKQTGRFY